MWTGWHLRELAEDSSWVLHAFGSERAELNMRGGRRMEPRRRGCGATRAISTGGEPQLGLT